MSSTMPKPKTIRLVIPDTGVLISLAHGDLLKFLLRFDPRIKIVITDVVAYEATYDPTRTDAFKIRQFIDQFSHRITVDPTAFAELIAKARTDPSVRLPKDAGEMSIYSYINDIRFEQPGIPTLVLFEDAWFMRNRTRPTSVHLVSIVAFLTAMEQRFPDFSLTEALDRIRHTRPDVQATFVDDPDSTEWVSTLSDENPDPNLRP